MYRNTHRTWCASYNFSIWELCLLSDSAIVYIFISQIVMTMHKVLCHEFLSTFLQLRVVVVMKNN